MTDIEKQALAVARAWTLFTNIDRRLADDRKRAERGASKRPAEERDRDMKALRPAHSAYQTAVETLARMVL